MTKLLLDANVIIRFLRADHEDHYRRSKCLFEQAELGEIRMVLLESVLAEVVFVLDSVYSVPKDRIAEALHPLFFHTGIDCHDSSVLSDALQRWCRKNVDFMDALLAAHANSKDIPVVSFDKDFRKFPDIRHVVPGTVSFKK